uniref:Smr domain-containing protein n=1 Tax=Caenorhabditis japonica TaxID=281687 RepID=A0A8R1DQL5_CAEJA
MRGASGSGKSTLARQIAEKSENFQILSSDELSSQHITKNVRTSIDKDVHLIIVDAENEDCATVKKLALIGTSNNYECFVLEPTTAWKYDAEECAQRSKSGQSMDAIREKVDNILNGPISWKHLVTGGEECVEIVKYNFDYPESFSLQSPTSFASTSPTSSSQSNTVLFSMKPLETAKLTRNVCTQVEVDNISRAMANLADEKPSVCITESEVSRPLVHNPNARLDRSEQFPDLRSNGRSRYVPLITSLQDLPFAMLRAIFCKTELTTIRHQLQIHGYQGAFEMLTILGEPTSVGILPTEDSILWDEVAADESRCTSNLTIEEEMTMRRRERLSLMFIEARHSETSNDEQIAMLLQAEFDQDNYKSPQNADRRNLERLQKSFPTAPPEMLVRVFHDLTDRDFDQSREILEYQGYYYEPVASPKQKSRWSRAVASSSSSASASASFSPTSSESLHIDLRKNHFLKQNASRLNLETAQREAAEERRKMSHKNTTTCYYNRQHHNTVLVERAQRMREMMAVNIKNIDGKLRDAHHDPWHLDLHYMSVEAAKKLVADALAAVRFRMKSEKRPRNRITVITGSGNNSRSGARIKPEVVKMLREMGVPFDQYNEGCITVKA